MAGLLSKPKVPKPEKPKALPNEELLEDAKKKRMAKERTMQGRTSTILSDDESNKLG